jgi:hypothetical protein
VRGRPSEKSPQLLVIKGKVEAAELENEFVQMDVSSTNSPGFAENVKFYSNARKV